MNRVMSGQARPLLFESLDVMVSFSLPPKHTPVSPWEQKEGEGARVRRAMAGEGRGRSKDAHLSQMINFEHLDEIGTR